MISKLNKIRQSFMEIQLSHSKFVCDSFKTIQSSKEAHEYIKDFCEENATHLMNQMNEISRDIAVFISRIHKADTLFNNLVLSINAVNSKKVKNIYQNYIEFFDKYSDYREDLEEWLYIIIAKWSIYEREVIEYCEKYE